MKLTKNLVKIDFSSNGLKSCVVKYLMDAMTTNQTVTEINLSNNQLSNEFAVDLAHVLEGNPILFKVDISQNPIGPEGAKYILNSLL